MSVCQQDHAWCLRLDCMEEQGAFRRTASMFTGTAFRTEKDTGPL